MSSHGHQWDVGLIRRELQVQVNFPLHPVFNHYINEKEKCPEGHGQLRQRLSKKETKKLKQDPMISWERKKHIIVVFYEILVIPVEIGLLKRLACKYLKNTLM